MVALAEPDAILTPASLSPEIAGAAHDAHAAHDGAPAMPLHAKLNPTLERIERETVKAALQKHRGRMEDVAKALGISRKGPFAQPLFCSLIATAEKAYVRRRGPCKRVRS